MPDHKHRGTWLVYFPHTQRLRKDGEVKDLPELHRLLEKIGLCFMADGRYDEAVKTHTAVIQWREMNLETSEQQKPDAYNDLGRHYITRVISLSRRRIFKRLSKHGSKSSGGACVCANEQ